MRLRANLVPAKKDKKAKRKGGAAAATEAAEAPELPIGVYAKGELSQAQDVSLANEVAWHQGALLQVGEEWFEVEVDPPTVERLQLSRRPLAGCPLLPACTLVMAEPGACSWAWQRRRPGSETWEDVGCRQDCYTPTAEDVKCVLRVECIPGCQRPAEDGGGVWQGEMVAAESGTVESCPDPSAAAIRLAAAPPKPVSPQHLRVMSYNLLADQYASTDYAQQVLFKYCPTQFLDIEYRKQLVMAELVAYEADIICLQEVDDRVFGDFLMPILERRGYTGRYTNKMGSVREGSATFYKSSRFCELAHHPVLLRDLFKLPLPAAHARFEPMLAASRELQLALQKVTTIAQVTLLQPLDCAGVPPICVANTHLFFHPYAPHIRTMHTAAILQEANLVMERTLGEGAPAAMLFCGDLNSDLNDGIPGTIELLQSGQVPADHWDWINGMAFKWERSEEEYTQQEAAAAVSGTTTPPHPHPTAPISGDGHDFESKADSPGHAISVPGIDVSIPFQLRSADDLKTPYSNYTDAYKALLDYVWYEPAVMQCVGQVAVPDEQHVKGFIPSQVFPSDHLAVVYDFKWNAECKSV